MENNADREKGKGGSPIKAISIGLVIDIGGSFLSATVLAIAYGVLLTSRGLSPEEIEHHLINLDPNSTFYIITMAVGGLMTVLGGYVCARIVNHSEYKFTFIFGFISAAIGNLLGGHHSTLETIALGILTLGCALFGAWLRVVQKANTPA